MGEFKCNSTMYSCAKQYGIILCSHKQGGTLTNSACEQSVDFISQYELMTHEQSQLLHLVKSTIVKVPPPADSERLPARSSWAQPPGSGSSSSSSACKGLFPNTTICSGFTSPGRDAAALALYALPKSSCQTLYLLVATSASICPAEPASDSLWPQAESQAFPSHPQMHRRTCIAA